MCRPRPRARWSSRPRDSSHRPSSMGLSSPFVRLRQRSSRRGRRRRSPRQGSMRPRSTARAPSFARRWTVLSSAAMSKSDRRLRPRLHRRCFFASPISARCCCSPTSARPKPEKCAPGDQVTFEVESIGVRTFTGTVSEVRLGSKLEQASQSGQPAATGSSGTPATTGTSGATGTSGTSPATAATTSPATTSTTSDRDDDKPGCRRTSGRGSLLHGGHQRR